MSEEELNSIEELCGITLPAGMRIIYRLHNGQEVASAHNPMASDQDKLNGLFGG